MEKKIEQPRNGPARAYSGKEWGEKDAIDLRWFWCEADAALGQRSSQGAQQDALSRAAHPGATRNAGEECMHVRETVCGVPDDPYPDEMLRHVARTRRIRATLSRCSTQVVSLLHAVYGPVNASPDTQLARKKFGDLTEVVVAIVNVSREPDDEPARRMVVRRLTNDAYVQTIRRTAEAFLRLAQAIYAKERQ